MEVSRAKMKPTTIGELQLYKVLQRANLIDYYQSFVVAGGDDLQQLYEADDNEFLEIMALVGMVSKPLHVRRFQKALNDWAMPHQQNDQSNSNNHDPSDNNHTNNFHRHISKQGSGS